MKEQIKSDGSKKEQNVFILETDGALYSGEFKVAIPHLQRIHTYLDYVLKKEKKGARYI
jgi:hypothetical protein